MLSQGLVVYFFLISTMLFFALLVARKGTYYSQTDGSVRERSFFRFEVLFPLVLFAIVFGMRWNVGADYMPYLAAYVYDDTDRFEWGFRVITVLFQRLNIHYVIYFTLWAFLQVFFFFYGFKHEYFLFPFLTLFIFSQSEVSFWMNGIRQALAMCIILYSVVFIEKKDILHYILFSILAVLFHRSSIVIVLLLYPLLFFGKCYFKDVFIQYLLLGVAFLGHAAFNSYLPRLENLLDVFNTLIGFVSSEKGYSMDQISGMEIDNQVGPVYVIRLIETLLIIGYSPKLLAFYNNRRFNILYNLFFIGIFLAYLAPGNVNNIDRLFRFFYIYRPVMLAYFAYYLKKNATTVNKLILPSLLVCDIGFWAGANVLSGWHFDFFFQHDISEVAFYLNDML